MKTKAPQPRGSARVSLHRFGDCAALAILNAPGTVYLDARAARQLARDCARLARSLESEPFQLSEYKAEPLPAFESSGESAKAARVSRNLTKAEKAERAELLREGVKAQARANFYDGNPRPQNKES
jgi:hypothetical protein